MELPVHSIWKKPHGNLYGLHLFFFWVKRGDLKWTVLVVNLWFQEVSDTAFPGSKRRAGGKQWGTCLSAQPSGIIWRSDRGNTTTTGQQLWIALWFVAQYCIEQSTLWKAENSSMASPALEGLWILPTPKPLVISSAIDSSCKIPPHKASLPYTGTRGWSRRMHPSTVWSMGSSPLLDSQTLFVCITERAEILS